MCVWCQLTSLHLCVDKKNQEPIGLAVHMRVGVRRCIKIAVLYKTVLTLH